MTAVHLTMMTKSAVIMSTLRLGLRRSKRVARVLAVNMHRSTALSILAKVKKTTFNLTPISMTNNLYSMSD